MSGNDDLIALIDQRIRSQSLRQRATGTCVYRDTTGVNAQVVFDGSTVAMPVKVLGSVHLQEGYRCVLDLYGSDWLVTDSWSARALGEASRNTFASSENTVNASFTDMSTFSTPIAFVKRYDVTMVRVAMASAAFSTAISTSARWAVRFTPDDPTNPYTPVDILTNYIYWNNASIHLSHRHAGRSIDLPAGSYTITVRWRRSSGSGTVTTDSNDMYSLEFDEAVRTSFGFL